MKTLVKGSDVCDLLIFILMFSKHFSKVQNCCYKSITENAKNKYLNNVKHVRTNI